MNVAPGKKAAVYVVSDNEGVRQIFEEGRQFFTSLAAASELTVQTDKSGIDDSAVSVVIPNATVYIPFEELVDIAQEIERLKKEQKRLEGELAECRGCWVTKGSCQKRRNRKWTRSARSLRSIRR